MARDRDVRASHFEPAHVAHRVMVGPTFAYSLFAPDDATHDLSRSFLEFVRTGELSYRTFLLNEHIVDEAATRLKTQSSMRNATKFLETVDRSDMYQVEAVTEDIFETARATFIDWSDHDASFTDFIVATHMDALDIDHILTYDRHFNAFDVTPLPHVAT